jgi:hypothetical protein
MSTAIPKTAALVTIRYVVMSVLNRLGEYNLKSYKKLTQIAIEGYTEELSLFHIGNSLEVVYLHMSTAKTVNLPADFITHTKIGVPINGELRVLTQHDQILMPRNFDDTGVAVGNTDDVNTNGTAGYVFFSEHFRNGQFVGGLYGLPGGIDEAYYRVDKEKRQIIFSGSVPRSEIVVEYISTGLKQDGSSLIPRECVDALRNYILWKMVETDMTGFMTGRAQAKTAMAEMGRRKQEFTESIAALRSFSNAFTKEELQRVIYGSARQSVKR